MVRLINLLDFSAPPDRISKPEDGKSLFLELQEELIIECFYSSH
jgi:hypothetical protein